MQLSMASRNCAKSANALFVKHVFFTYFQVARGIFRTFVKATHRCGVPQGQRRPGGRSRSFLAIRADAACAGSDILTSSSSPTGRSRDSPLGRYRPCPVYCTPSPFNSKIPSPYFRLIIILYPETYQRRLHISLFEIISHRVVNAVRFYPTLELPQIDLHRVLT